MVDTRPASFSWHQGMLDARADATLDTRGPLVARAFNIMARNGRIPEPPRGLDGRGLQVEFISILAQAQKSAATVGIERMWQFKADDGSA